MRRFIRLTIAVLCVSIAAFTCFACGETEPEPKEKTVLDSPVIASAVYTGEKQTAAVPESDGYTVTTNDGGISAGNYDVVLTLTDAESYAWKTPDESNAATVTLKFTITKADNEITSLTIADWFYGKEANKPVAAAKFGTPSFTYSTAEDGEYTAAVPTAAGKYFVKAAVEGTNDYSGAEKVVSFEIKKAKPAYTELPEAVESLKYDGSAHTLVAAGATADGTVEYRLGEDGEWSENIPTATNAGSYEVWYRIKGDDAHADIEAEEPIAVVIAQADVTVTAPTAKTGLEYTGASLALVEPGSVTAGTMMYRIGGEGGWSESVPTAVNAGKYTVQYTVTVDENYKKPQDGEVEIVIAKANATVTAPTAKTLTYTGSAQELIAAGSVVGGKMQYKLSAETEWSDNIPTATNAGTYTVEYKIVPDDNHNAAEGGSVEVTIDKIDASVTAPTAKTGLAYTGSAQELIAAGSVVGGKMQYKLSTETEWSDNIPTATNAGTYTVEYKVVVDGNYNEPQGGSVEVVIAKMANSVKFDTASMDVTYPDVPAPKATATFGEITYTYATVENKDNAEAYGDWKTIVSAGAGRQYYCKATAAGGNNHETATEIRLFTVHKGANAFSEFELTAATLKCGNEIGYTAKANGGTVVVKYSVGENGQYYSWSELLKKMIELDANNAIGNGFTYWARAFVENDDFYTDATADARSFVLNHDFENGVCKGCNYAQTGIAYGETETEVYVTGYSGNHSKEVYILAEYNGKPVTYIAHQAFRDKTIKKIVMPTGITDLGGLVFQDCRELEYVDMRGIDKLLYNKDGRPDGQNGCDNNFLNCIKLTTVIVKNGYTSEGCGAQFSVNGEITNPEKVVNLYAYGTATVSAHANDKLFTGTIYYLGDGVKCFTWKFDENGKIKTGPIKHDFVDGKCATCGLYMVEYAYDSAGTSYYVKGFAAGINEEEVVIVEKYNDGTNGEHPVTYVAAEAFANNQTIKKVIMPGITDIGGRSFDNCAALEYVDMRGVTYIPYAKSEPARPDNANDANNNFINCVRLTTVIVGNGYHAAAQQFVLNGKEKINEAVLYVNGTGLAQLDNGDSLMSGTIYYLGDGEKCFTWKFDENGKIKTGPIKHNYGTDGKCTLCQADSGVEYAYDSANQTYYVKGLKTGVTVQEVVIVEKYNDGTNGEHPVTYVANRAFAEKSFIRRVIMPSVTDLGGQVFWGCENLEYVDMRGVTYISYANKDGDGNAKRPDGSVESNNNFRFCNSLATVIVGNGYSSETGQFNSDHTRGIVDLYVYGTSTVTTHPDDKILSGNVYYYSDTEKAGAWHYEGGIATLW